MNEEFDPEAFWEAYEEQKQDKEFFEAKIKESQEVKDNIIEFPITLRFELDIKALEERVSDISIALDDLSFELSQLRRRLKKQ